MRIQNTGDAGALDSGGNDDLGQPGGPQCLTQIREYLETSAYVASWRPGGSQEGGDGATRVELER